jgi:hypothetical protein
MFPSRRWPVKPAPPARFRVLGQFGRRYWGKVTVTVLAFNLLGDGIRDTLDSKLSPAVLRLVTGSGRAEARAGAGEPSEVPTG